MSTYYTSKYSGEQIDEAVRKILDGEMIGDYADRQLLNLVTPQLRVAAMAFAASATTIPDAQALEMPDLFPTWEAVLANGKELAAERVISKDGQLYRVAQPVTPQEHQPPDGEGMLAIYRPINPEHAGTADDPIPWVYGMDCHAGKYYSYEGAVYMVAEGGNMIPCTWPPDSGIWQWVKVS